MIFSLANKVSPSSFHRFGHLQPRLQTSSIWTLPLDAICINANSFLLGPKKGFHSESIPTIGTSCNWKHHLNLKLHGHKHSFGLQLLYKMITKQLPISHKSSTLRTRESDSQINTRFEFLPNRTVQFPHYGCTLCLMLPWNYVTYIVWLFQHHTIALTHTMKHTGTKIMTVHTENTALVWKRFDVSALWHKCVSIRCCNSVIHAANFLCRLKAPHAFK